MHLMQMNQPDVMTCESSLESYFYYFRENTIGNSHTFDSPFGKKRIIYADWTASGRAYRPIEDKLRREIMPFIGNTHTDTNITGTLMSKAYEQAKQIIKRHVGANEDDVLLFCGSGMTAAVNKLQRILGLRIPERVTEFIIGEDLPIDETLRPVVFVTHMEHHSNHTSWLETIATVKVIQPDKDGHIDLDHFRSLLEKYKNRKTKIAAVTASSNVTGIETQYQEIAKLVHTCGGWCFVDFAGSAPYVNIDMHPADKTANLDAIYCSPHKFLGGPGTPGILIFNKAIYRNRVPDQPGGGTVEYSNPWGGHEYTANIEQREDGGTPPFLQAIKAAMCIRLKEQMGVENILAREEELLQLVFSRFSEMENVEVLAGNVRQRLGVMAFIVKGAHYNLIVTLLNDRFGIQTRGGCSCAGTYGHFLLNVDEPSSCKILEAIRAGNQLSKPGWVRLSIHPTMTNAEIDYIMDAIQLTASHFGEWADDYIYDHETNAYNFKVAETTVQEKIEDWFNAGDW